MESVVNMRRSAAWNVVFLLPDDTEFAGLFLPNEYVDVPAERQLRFSDALSWILSSFHLELERPNTVEGDNRKFAWALIPRTGILHKMAKCGDGLSSRVMQERLSMDLPLTKGRYYLVKHLESCSKGIDYDGTFRGGWDHMGSMSILYTRLPTSLLLSTTLPAQGLMTPPTKSQAKLTLFQAECVNQVVGAKPKQPADYRPWIRSSPPAYDVDEDGNVTVTVTHCKLRAVPEGVTYAKMSMNDFHQQAPHMRCAVTGLGQSAKHLGALSPWLDISVDVNHIIPPEYYDAYPINGSSKDASTTTPGGPDEDDGGFTAADKWDMTWDPELNGIVLLKHHATLLKARFVAVEPESMTVHAFASYDTLTPYHGKKADFAEGKTPDIEALRWNWRMCVYENMVARIEKVNKVREEEGKAAASKHITTEEMPPTPPASADDEAEVARREDKANEVRGKRSRESVDGEDEESVDEQPPRKKIRASEVS